MSEVVTSRRPRERVFDDEKTFAATGYLELFDERLGRETYSAYSFRCPFCHGPVKMVSTGVDMKLLRYDRPQRFHRRRPHSWTRA